VSKKFERGESFSAVISGVSPKIHPDGITLNDLLELIGERGLFMSCLVLAAPFLIPISIPGSSIPFGLAIILITISIIFNRPVLLPKRVLDYKISKDNLETILNGILRILTPLEKFITPRILILTRGTTMIIINGSLMVFSAILLMLPLPIPLTDSLPAYGILFLALGDLERDGFLILVGYFIVIITAIYFGLIVILGYDAILAILTYLGLHF
jgi:hypothetical protein